MTAPVEVLVVEDNEPDARLIREMLGPDGGYALDHVEDVASALARIEQVSPDVVLLDLDLPDSVGLSAVTRVRTSAPQVPIVVLTGLRDQDAGKQAVREGAEDFLVKGRFDRALLERSILYAIERHQRQTELRRVNAELVTQRDALARAQAQKAELTALVVHDLKNPISTLISYCYLMLEGELPDKPRGHVTTMMDVCQSMTRLVMNILDIDRSEDGKLEARLEPFDLVGLAQDVCRLMGGRAQRLGRALKLDAPATLPIVGDRDMLRRLLENLLDNAIKHTPRGAGIQVLIARPEPGGAEMRVMDEGPGVPVALREKIFEKYVRLDGSAGQSQMGSRGLGLVFCQRAAAAHGGRITVDDRDPHGAVFALHLPAEPSPKA